MFVTNSNPYSYGVSGSEPSTTQIQAADSAFAALISKEEKTPESILAEMTKDGVTGMMKWKIREMEKEIAAKVMQAKNLTPEKIASMPPKERIAVEQQIMREVAEKLKQAMHEDMQKHARGQGTLAIMNANSLDITA